MPAALIKDYLQTQGLRLPVDDVRVAYMTAQAVLNMGQASVERSILWRESNECSLAQHFEQNHENEALIKQIFMALDSTFTRTPNVQSAAIYAHMPSENLSSQLVCLTQQGKGLEEHLTINEESPLTHLACRTAQTGWMNIADDVAYWLSLDELKGERNQHSGSQISVPVCTADGKVLGVIHVEYPEKKQADDVAQTDWVALALALIEPMKTLLGVEDDEEEQDD